MDTRFWFGCIKAVKVPDFRASETTVLPKTAEPELTGAGGIMGGPTILMRGLPHFVRMLAPALSSSDLRFEPSAGRGLSAFWKFLRARGLYYISASASHSRLASLALLLRKPVIMHWVGSDVLQALADHRAGKLSPRLVRSCVHWTEVPWTAEELASAGISAEVVPLAPVEMPDEIPPLPETFTVLTYFGLRHERYGSEHLIQLAKDFPQVPFLLVGQTELASTDLPKNIRFFGHVDDISAMYARCSVLIRMTTHDGLSFMVLEALARGRHVIWTYPVEGARLARNYSQLCQHISHLLALHSRKQLKINSTGVAFVRREYQPEKVVGNLRYRLRRLIAQSNT